MLSIPFLYFNARSIRSSERFCEFLFCLSTNSDSFVVICETWLDSAFSENSFSPIDTHLVVRSDRSNSPHGGVLIAIPKVFHFQKIHASSNDFFESIWLDIFFKNTKLFRISCFYRTPSTNDHRVSTISICDEFRQFSNSNMPTYIFGDFNYPEISWVNFQTLSGHSEAFYNSILELGLLQKVDKPTHIFGNMLDLIFVNAYDLIGYCFVNGSFSTSDHFIIQGKLGPFQLKLEKSIIKFKNFRKTDLSQFGSFLDNTDWENVLNGDSIESIWLNFKNICHESIKKFVPVCTFNSKILNWSKNTINAHKKQKALHKKWKISRNPAHHKLWLSSATIARRLKRSDLICFEEKILNSNNERRFWSYLKHKLSPKSEIPLLNHNGAQIVDDYDKAILLNEYFVSVMTVDNNVHVNSSDPGIYLSDIDFSPDIVLKHLKKLKNKVSAGIDQIPQSLLFDLPNSFAKPLSIIFTKCFDLGLLPSEWKTAKIFPKHKKGNKNLITNYRPISNLCAVSKVFESIIAEVLILYLIHNNFLNKNQHGFRKMRSTVTQLLEIMVSWINAIVSGKNIDVFYIDLAKAFDTVSHQKLLQILKNMGIRGKLLKWFESYLTNRTQVVVIENSISPPIMVTSGVPQGSILGPILFLMYTNNLDDFLFFMSHKLFADDAKMWYSYQSFNVNPIQIDLNNLQGWSEYMQMQIASEKCSLMHIGKNNPCRSYTICDNDVPIVDSFNDLGVHFTNTLSFSNHCEKTAKKGFNLVWLIHRSFHFKKPNFLSKIFCSYVRPILEYASEIWNPHLLKDIIILERVQKLFTRLIPGFQRFTYVERLEKLKMKTLEERRLIKDLILLFKMINGLVDLDNSQFFSFSQIDFTRGHSKKIIFPKIKSDIEKYSFPNRIIFCWNDLPSAVVEASSLNLFRKCVNELNLSKYLKFQG